MSTKTPTEPFHPDLAAARWIPLFSAGKRSLPLFRMKRRGIRSTPSVRVETMSLPAGAGQQLPARVFRPLAASAYSPAPALFWIHGGGLIIGTPQQDDATNLALAAQLGIVVVAPSYRLAPEHPAPAALDDLAATYRHVLAHADEFGVDPARVAVGGASAGGGLAAALAQRLLDDAAPQPAFQLLVYPMLDDRTTARDDIDTRRVRMWSPASNRFAWTSYLAAVDPDARAAVVPARRRDLTGLPPAWIGVGTHDLFHDEDVDYARRLNDAGVPCELSIVPGAFHGFDAIFRTADVSRAFHAEWAEVLRAALRIDDAQVPGARPAGTDTHAAASDPQ